ncbi:MAG: cardiolipin synthase [Oscillibacter sp.]|nr:cardiolipin synthase [Oscillibacter sp.]
MKPKLLKMLFGRAGAMLLIVLMEALLLFGFVRNFYEHLAWIEGVLRLFSVLIVLHIIRTSRHLSSDLMWILLIILFPVSGTLVYLFLGANLITSRTLWNLVSSTADSKRYYQQDPAVLREMEKHAPAMRGQFRYIAKSAGFPFYRNAGFDYYGLGEQGYPVMLDELRKAQRFIFLEYFIITEGAMWNGILEILEEKAKQGLDVRVMYDDMGSFMTLSPGYAKRMEQHGIQCVSFNRINPVLNAVMNHRDHRKIMVIDGETAFSGGINLADEYINVHSPYGHWKDNVIRVTGDAVWSFTVMFLTHWNAIRKQDNDFTKFRVSPRPGQPDGYIAPYGETPLDDEITSQNIYMNILNQSNDYCYICTPYLIIDTELTNALILAAHRGVDVRILTPGIPDKKLVWNITRSFYKSLILGGVRIYEYTPGFVHAKVFVSDDRVATVGTVNLDYRSLYLHFENGTYLYASQKIADIKRDYLDTLSRSHEMTAKESTFGPLKTFGLSVLRLFAPLL